MQKHYKSCKIKDNMQQKTLVNNRAAAHEYFILETYESGIVLDGGEVKSLRTGGGNLKDAFCYIVCCFSKFNSFLFSISRSRGSGL